MIEFCSRKRMVLVIIVLFSLTVLTLIVEGMWSSKHKLNEINSDKEESLCESSDIQITASCRPCLNTENTVDGSRCQKTGFIEIVRCGKDNEMKSFKRSCKMDPWIEERKFWILEILTFVAGMTSFGVVKYRQRILDCQLTERVNKQIAA